MKYKSGSLKRKDTVNPNPISEKSSDNVNARAGDRLLSKNITKTEDEEDLLRRVSNNYFFMLCWNFKKKEFSSGIHIIRRQGM